LTYYFIRVENNGCVLIDSVAISLLSAGTTVSNDQFLCAGDTAIIFVSNDFPGSQLSHSWEPEESIVEGQGTSLIRVVVTEPTTFTVTSVTPEGCSIENSSTVFTSALGGTDVAASADPENIVVGSSSQISVIPVGPEYFYGWSPPDFLENPSSSQTTSTPSQTITYTITVSEINDLGICSKTDSVTISVFESICGSPNIYVPNAFTPNGDGENDLLLVRGGGITSLKFMVFNRWGNKVFETEDQQLGWDGSYNGNLAEPAVFVYQLEAVCGDGQTYFEKGNVTLIR
jgi:gliding motility-associated-like protein